MHFHSGIIQFKQLRSFWRPGSQGFEKVIFRNRGLPLILFNHVQINHTCYSVYFCSKRNAPAVVPALMSAQNIDDPFAAEPVLLIERETQSAIVNPRSDDTVMKTLRQI